MNCGIEDSRKQPFQFFNDNAEWKQVDKIGHFYSTYYFSYGTSKALRWCNVKQKKADLIGSLVGFGVMLPIEILDGFSESYGASAGDLVANAAGSAFFLGKLYCGMNKGSSLSFHFTEQNTLRCRPSVLGEVPLAKFSRITTDKPIGFRLIWTSLYVSKVAESAVGYGAEGMVYARDEQNIEAGYSEPIRQYYLSIDFDLTAIKSRSKAVNTLIFFASMIKIPAPTIEFSSKGTKFTLSISKAKIIGAVNALRNCVFHKFIVANR